MGRYRRLSLVIWPEFLQADLVAKWQLSDGAVRLPPTISVGSNKMSFSTTLEILPVAQEQLRALHLWDKLAHEIESSGGLREKLPVLKVANRSECLVSLRNGEPRSAAEPVMRFKLGLTLRRSKTNSSRSWN